MHGDDNPQKSFENFKGEGNISSGHLAYDQGNQTNIVSAVTREDLLLYTAVALMLLIIIVGAVGNVMVILAVKTTRKLQTIANVFVVNLSVCDLLFVSCVLPFNIYTYTVGGWYLSPALCKFVGFLGYTLTGTTLVNIAMIAWNRYQLVTNMGNYKELFNGQNMLILILLSWILPALVLMPALLEIWGKFGFVAMLVTCNLLLSHNSQSFKLFLLVVRALIPSALIMYCYIFIYRTMRASHRKMHRQLSNPQIYDMHQQKQEMHLTRMMIVIFLVFAVSYFPCTITGIIDWNTILSKDFHMFCAMSVYIGSALNPLIYGLMNQQFREAYIRLMTCGFLLRPRKQSAVEYSITRRFNSVVRLGDCSHQRVQLTMLAKTKCKNDRRDDEIEERMSLVDENEDS